MGKTSLEKSKIRVLLLEGIHKNAEHNLRQNGYTNIECLSTALTGDDLKEKLKDAHFIGIRSGTRLTADILESAPKLMAIGCFCIGTNQVDLEAALIRGIPVFNAPYSNTRSVAELVLAQSIMLMRGIPDKNAKAHRGQWLKSAKSSHEVRGKTLGIIGYGSIGSQLSVLAEQMGMKVVFHDIMAKLPIGNAEQAESLEALLNQSNIVTLHVPETPETRLMFGEKQLSQMPEGSYLINASRGTVVDIEALCHALASDHLAGAAVDVFPKEPKSNDEEFISPLREFDNVILTPHIGGSTVEAQENIGLEVSEKFIRYSDNGSTISAVNFPEVALPAQPDCHRVLHLHHNIPGMLSQINAILAENDVNIRGQFLQTNDTVGYVVIDLDSSTSALVLEKLQAIEGTIRIRILF